VSLDLLERHAALGNEGLEQLIGRGRRCHIERLSAKRKRQAHVPAELKENSPIFEHITPSRRLDQRRLILRIGLRVTERQAIDGDAFVTEGDRG
jgi:hypothetical protein